LDKKPNIVLKDEAVLRRAVGHDEAPPFGNGSSVGDKVVPVLPTAAVTKLIAKAASTGRNNPLQGNLLCSLRIDSIFLAADGKVHRRAVACWQTLKLVQRTINQQYQCVSHCGPY
jgi:hypothetical protein